MCDAHHDPPEAAARLAPRPLPLDLDAFAAGERIPLEPVESITVTSLVDNSTDALLMDMGPAHRPPLAAWPERPSPLHDPPARDVPRAEHGYSVLVHVTLGDGSTRRLLYDTGVSPDGVVENMRRLDLAPGDVELVICSHGHFDHTGGLEGLVAAVGRTNLPIVLHPAFWSKRRVAIPGRDPFVLPTMRRKDVEAAGVEVIERPEPSLLFERSVLVTGEVARTTPFETGWPVHQAWRAGSWEPDPLILDDQALIVSVRDAGLVVVTGCGHAGIVNTLRYARHLTGVEQVYAVFGGFHLSGPAFEPIIGPTIDGLVELSPSVLVPSHCTGWKAIHGIAARLPDAFIPNSVGTRYELTAPASS